MTVAAEPADLTAETVTIEPSPFDPPVTDHQIRMLRGMLTIEISEMQRLRFACVEALGGDAMSEDTSPRSNRARAVCAAAINARNSEVRK